MSAPEDHPGTLELAFGGADRHTHTYCFTPQNNFVIERAGLPDHVTVLMVLRPVKLTAGGGQVFVANTEYTLNSGNIDQAAFKLTAKLTGSIVAYVHSEVTRGLERFRFPGVANVWIGEGFDTRLILEVEGDGDIPELDDHVFLLGAREDRNALGEWTSINFFRNGTVAIRLSHDRVNSSTHLYWALPQS